MRISSTLISGAVAAVAVAGSANASVTWLDFASMTGTQSVVNTNTGFDPDYNIYSATSSGFAQAVGSPSGTGGSWAADRFLRADFTSGTSVNVTGGSATFNSVTADVLDGGGWYNAGNASMVWSFDSAKNLNGIQFRLNVAALVGIGSVQVSLCTDTAGQNPLAAVSQGVTVGTNNVFAFGFAGNTLQSIRSMVVTWNQFNVLDQPASASMTLNGIEYNGVPAPGAIALLGMAGLAGRRRRS